MTQTKVATRVLTNKVLVQKLISETAAMVASSAAGFNSTALRRRNELEAQVLERMAPDEPLRTVETTFGTLVKRDEFLLMDECGTRCRAVSRGNDLEKLEAITLDGISPDMVFTILSHSRVRKIMK